MSCAPCIPCKPAPFTLFQSCEPQCEPVCVTNDWEICQENGKTRVKLDCGYLLEFDERRSELWIIKPCGEKTRIWGDPHVDVGADGTNDFDFWGTTTFELKDGTKITINTEPWRGNTAMTLANNVVVTKGEKSLIVNGLSQNALGDFVIEKGLNGRALDRAVWDGKLTVRENPNGRGWVDETGGPVTTALDGNRSRPAAGDPTQATFVQQQAILDAAPTHAGACKPKYCFSWLEALASAFAMGLTRQVDKMDFIYRNLTLCYSLNDKTCLSHDEYLKFCESAGQMGTEIGDTLANADNWTENTDGTWTPKEAAVKAADKGAMYWQQMLTGASQQLQITAQTGMTVQNAASQALLTVARAN